MNENTDIPQQDQPVTPAVADPVVAPQATPVVPQGEASTVPTPVFTPVASAPLAHGESMAKKINRIMAYVLIISGISFVLIAILAIWNVFGDDAGTVVWRSLGSLGAIALGALIVSVASKIITDHQQ